MSLYNLYIYCIYLFLESMYTSSDDSFFFHPGTVPETFNIIGKCPSLSYMSIAIFLNCKIRKSKFNFPFIKK